MRLGSVAGAGVWSVVGSSSSASPYSQKADKSEEARLELAGVERRHVDALADQRAFVATVHGDAAEAGAGAVVIGGEQRLQTVDILKVGDVERR